jgi:hypothetical protein
LLEPVAFAQCLSHRATIQNCLDTSSAAAYTQYMTVWSGACAMAKILLTVALILSEDRPASHSVNLREDQRP